MSAGVDGGSDDEDEADDNEVEPEPAGHKFDDDDEDEAGIICLWPLRMSESGSMQYGLRRPPPPPSASAEPTWLVALTERHSPGGGSDTAL